MSIIQNYQHITTKKPEAVSFIHEDVAEFRDATDPFPNLTDYIDDLEYDEGSGEMTDDDYL